MKDKKIRPSTDRVGGDVAGTSAVGRNNAGASRYGHQGLQHPRPEKVTEYHRGGKPKR
jgi:hypothetical protein